MNAAALALLPGPAMPQAMATRRELRAHALRLRRLADLQLYNPDIRALPFEAHAVWHHLVLHMLMQRRPGPLPALCFPRLTFRVRLPLAVLDAQVPGLLARELLDISADCGLACPFFQVTRPRRMRARPWFGAAHACVPAAASVAAQVAGKRR